MSERSEKKMPSFEAFHAKDGPEDKSYFNRIGAAFPHKDGEGHTIALDAVPVDGRIVLRTPKERLEEAKSEKPRKRNRDERDR
ncbi:hypothetical protein JCM17846_28640 [Iodidimonas nitroreducens]|uniref:Uncharacterized protein n=1 Tax=Iodidimonas nitroreducens TaxID=1236968 RepID=A0A5A7NAC5_9PROT|nr:hypothetical protein [Iodidimonas nitroreducens]GAK34635.1 hypothetical protein AQ1_02534 [alpha proteobacterium Q-1]GER05182.1 hypothetical protein JCM17846_28640 [Iodidimonas nitroreducens]